MGNSCCLMSFTKTARSARTVKSQAAHWEVWTATNRPGLHRGTGSRNRVEVGRPQGIDKKHPPRRCEVTRVTPPVGRGMQPATKSYQRPVSALSPRILLASLLNNGL